MESEVVFTLSRKPRSDGQTTQRECGFRNGVELGTDVLQNNIATTLNLNDCEGVWSDVRCDPDMLTVTITLKNGCEDYAATILELLNNKGMHRCPNQKDVILRSPTGP